MKLEAVKGSLRFRAPLRFIYVEWEDATRNRHEWMDPSEAQEWAEGRSGIIHEGGFEIENTNDRIVLAAAYSPESVYNEEQINGITKIPKTWIRKRCVLFELSRDGRMKRRDHRATAGRRRAGKARR